MEETIKNKMMHLAELQRNPMADINNIQRLKKELELINVAYFTPEDWQLYRQAFKD